MTSAARSLIDHVQGVVKPSNQLPAPPTHTPDTSTSDSWQNHPRPEIPDWIPPNGPQDEPLDPGEEVVWEPEETVDADLSDEIDHVPGTPIDVLAYYLPFHFYGQWWGIYIRATGALSVAAYLARQGRAGALTSYEINAALRLLIEHEAFHHRVEMACTREELPLLDFLYGLPGLRSSPYEWYFWNTPAGLHEEAMANANALIELAAWQVRQGVHDSTSRQLQLSVSQLMESQPAGYKDFGLWVDNKCFSKGKDIVLGHFRNSAYHKIISSAPPSGLVRGRRYFIDGSISACPVYLILDRISRGLRRLRPFPKDFGMRIKVHTNDHPPPHIHLELPVGTELGRYEWPSFEPLSGSEPLSRSIRKTVDSYVGLHGRKIDAKMRSVYADL